jgi:FecR protein/Carboxypeptidase regulatory-like domain
MKDPTGNPRQIVDRFLGNMAEPVSKEQSERATSDVLERLRTENLRVLTFPTVLVEPRPVRSNVWSAIAAGLAVILAGGLLQLFLQRSAGVEIVARPVSGEIQIVGAKAIFPKHSAIEAGKVLKAGSEGGAIALLDGSQIDMSSDAELSISREEDGFRVHLASGTVLVTAAKQHDGHLYVETKDCVVSVTGTVFAVSAEETGSRVSVLEGAVQIHRGEISQTLLAGQQATTSPQLGPLPLDAAIARSAQQLPAQAPQTSNSTTGRTVRGVVKGTNGAGIPDVSVTLCPNLTEVRAEPAPKREFNFQVGVTFDDTVHVDGPIIRNKAFFFGIWDNCVNSTVLTDSMGRFEFSNVEPGEYAVRAQRQGFSGPSDDGSLDGRLPRYFKAWTPSAANPGSQLTGDSLRVTVYAQQVSQEISLSLIRAGVIAGHVRDVDGKPVVNARVRIVAPPVPGAAGEGLTRLTTTTNDLGEYRAYWLTPGEYRVVASGPRSHEFWFTRGAPAPEGSLVALREGEEVSNIDVVLRPGADEPQLRWYSDR